MPDDLRQKIEAFAHAISASSPLCFAHESLSDEDVDLFLGPFNEHSKVVRFSERFDFAEMAVALNIFPSKGQARKNGWSGPIPEGYGERHYKRVFTVGWLQQGAWTNSGD